MLLSDTEAAYIAGIIDGEGSLSISKKENLRGHNPSYGLHFTVTNTNKLLLDWLRQKLRAGQITKKPRSNTNWKLCYQLVFATSEIQTILEVVTPYLIVRKHQAQLVLEFLSLSWQQTGNQKEKPVELVIEQELIYEELRALNKRGA